MLNKNEKFTIKKIKIGVASVLVGVTLLNVIVPQATVLAVDGTPNATSTNVGKKVEVTGKATIVDLNKTENTPNLSVVTSKVNVIVKAGQKLKAGDYVDLKYNSMITEVLKGAKVKDKSGKVIGDIVLDMSRSQNVSEQDHEPSDSLPKAMYKIVFNKSVENMDNVSFDINLDKIVTYSALASKDYDITSTIELNGKELAKNVTRHSKAKLFDRKDVYLQHGIVKVLSKADGNIEGMTFAFSLDQGTNVASDSKVKVGDKIVITMPDSQGLAMQLADGFALNKDIPANQYPLNYGTNHSPKGLIQNNKNNMVYKIVSFSPHKAVLQVVSIPNEKWSGTLSGIYPKVLDTSERTLDYKKGVVKPITTKFEVIRGDKVVYTHNNTTQEGVIEGVKLSSRGDVVKKGSVITHFVDDKGKRIKDDIVAVDKGLVGKDYKIVPSEVQGYRFKEVKKGDALTGKVIEGVINVTLVYVKNGEPVKPKPPVDPVSPQQAVTFTEYVLENGQLVPNTTRENGDRGKKEIVGYTYVKSLAKNSNNVIQHVYRLAPKPTFTEYVLENGQLIPNTVREKGTLDKKEIATYVFVKTIPINNDGVTKHVYKKVVAPTPQAKKYTEFVDEKGNLLPNETRREGSLPKKDIQGYTYVRSETNGDLTKHIYKKVVAPTPQVKKYTEFVDEKGNPISPRLEGTLDKKDVQGYTYVRSETKNGVTKHYYVKDVTQYVDVTNNDKPVVIKTTDGSNPKEELSNYEFVRTIPKNDKGVTKHEYVKLSTEFVDKDGKLIAEREEGKVNKKDIKGYTYVRSESKNGVTRHFYDRNMTQFIDNTNPKSQNVMKLEEGDKPKEDLDGYVFEKTEPKNNEGVTKHFYKKAMDVETWYVEESDLDKPLEKAKGEQPKEAFKGDRYEYVKTLPKDDKGIIRHVYKLKKQEVVSSKVENTSEVQNKNDLEKPQPKKYADTGEKGNNLLAYIGASMIVILAGVGAFFGLKRKEKTK